MEFGALKQISSTLQGGASGAAHEADSGRDPALDRLLAILDGDNAIGDTDLGPLITGNFSDEQRPPVVHADPKPASSPDAELTLDEVMRHAREIIASKSGLVVTRPVKRGVSACYLDWGHTLTSLDPDQRHDLFELLRARGMEIHILSQGGALQNIAAELEAQGSLGLLTSITAVTPDVPLSSISSDMQGGVELVSAFGFNKAAVIQKRHRAYEAMLIDDEDKNLAWAGMVRVGVLDGCDGTDVSRGDCYLHSLRDLKAVAELLDRL